MSKNIATDDSCVLKQILKVFPNWVFKENKEWKKKIWVLAVRRLCRLKPVIRLSW